MRHQYLFDGVGGGVLSVTEGTDQDRVVLGFAQDGRSMAVELSEAEFRALAELRYRLNFVRSELPQRCAA